MQAKRMIEIQYHTVKDLYQQTIRAMCSFIKVLISVLIRLEVVAYDSLKTNIKSSWVIPKVDAVAYESFKSHGSIGLSQR